MSIENKSEATLILRSLRKNILKLHLISTYRPDRKRYYHFLLQIIIKCAQSPRPHKFISQHWLFYFFICFSRLPSQQLRRESLAATGTLQEQPKKRRLRRAEADPEETVAPVGCKAGCTNGRGRRLRSESKEINETTKWNRELTDETYKTRSNKQDIRM